MFPELDRVALPRGPLFGPPCREPKCGFARSENKNPRSSFPMVSGGSRPGYGYGCGCGLGKTAVSTLYSVLFLLLTPNNQVACCTYSVQRVHSIISSTVHSDANETDRHCPCYFARFVSFCLRRRFYSWQLIEA